MAFESVLTSTRKINQFVLNYYPDNSLNRQYETLQEEHVKLKIKLRKYDLLRQENARLLSLLSASDSFSERVLLAEIVTIDVELYNHKLILNKGLESDVFVGQAAISADGVLGQVTSVGYKRSVVTLITDPNHGLPVEVQRHGYRAIVQGAGELDLLKMPFVDKHADIQLGDKLVTSGMGGLFPEGYMVGEVVGIVNDADEAFLDITVRAMTRINYIKEVLLVWNNGQSEEFDAHRENGT